MTLRLWDLASARRRFGYGMLFVMIVSVHGAEFTSNAIDLPLNFHPTAIRVPFVDTPEGAM
jgi:hypothetical protein